MNCFLSPLLFASALAFSEGDFSLEHATISVYAVHIGTGEVLIDHNSDMSLIPASCMKIITTAAALDVLGPEERFETTLEYEGRIDEQKTLHGNLYIRGGGDPCLGSLRTGSWQKQVETWVDAVHTLGVQRIEGKVIGDASRWEAALAVPSWSWEDLGNYYGAGACALSFHENSYSLFFLPGNAVGENASIARTEPPIPMLSFHNEVKTGPRGSGDRACIYGSEFSPVQWVRGTVPLGVDEFAIKGAIPDPSAFCADVLAQALESKGIAIARREIPHGGGRIAIHTTLSPPVKEIVHWTNQRSINLYAEHLLKKMGETAYREGSTHAGVKAVRTFLEAQGIPLEGFRMVDGSGLSRQNLVTAKQFVSLLLKMKKSPLFPLFFSSLPQKEGLIQAKSGSMSLVQAYAGYAGEIAFALLANHYLDRRELDQKIALLFSRLNSAAAKPSGSQDEKH